MYTSMPGRYGPHGLVPGQTKKLLFVSALIGLKKSPDRITVDLSIAVTWTYGRVSLVVPMSVNMDYGGLWTIYIPSPCFF